MAYNDKFLIEFANTEGGIVMANELDEQHRYEQQRHKEPKIFRCPDCNGVLTIVAKTSKKRSHFRHKKDAGCFLSEKIGWTKQELDELEEYNKYRLFNRDNTEHGDLQNAIKEKLESDKKNSNIKIEKYFEGLRADIFCERGGKKLAFEIQLSPLPLKIIDKRVQHYRNREEPVYLFWIKKYDNSRLSKDIKTYGGSENLYEFCDGDNLFKCHYKSYQLGYRDGLLKPILVKQEKEINLADLHLSKNESNEMPYVVNLKKEKAKYEKIMSDIKTAVEKRSKKMLEDICTRCHGEFDKNEYDDIEWYIHYLLLDMSLLNKDVFYAARKITFCYIEAFREDIGMKSVSDCSDSDDPNAKVYSDYILPCPFECRKNHEKGAFIVSASKHTHGRCDNCDHESDLIDYLGRYDRTSNAKAAQKICKKLYIPYKT